MARRGKATKAKRSLGSKYQKVMVDAQAMRQLQVYRYPFSVATSQPKIPDGCNTQTIGIKLQKQFSQKSDGMLFVLMPIYGLLLHVRYNRGEQNVLAGVNPPVVTSYVDHQIRHLDGIPSFDLPANGQSFNNTSAYSAYRLVSAGLRLKLISNDNENDGYWEAIRFNNSELSNNYYMAVTNTPTVMAAPVGNNPAAPAAAGLQTYVTQKAGSFALRPEFLTTLYNKSNWLNNPTYQMGKLKSLSQFEFRLSPQVEEHEFISIPKKIELDHTTLYEDLAGVLQTPLNTDVYRMPNLADAQDHKHLFEFGMDPAFDCIAIFCTGFTREGTSSNILAHTCFNYEFKLDPDSPTNMYATETTNAGTALKSKQMDFKVRDRLPGHYLAGPRS